MITKQYGYYTGLYANKDLVRNSNLVSLLNRDYVKEIWLAHYGKCDGHYRIGEHTLSNSKDWVLDEDCSMYQVSENGYLFDKSEKSVDMNLCDPELFDRVNRYYGNNKIKIL